MIASDEERMQDLHDSVQRIFQNAVTPTPSFPKETENPDPVNKKPILISSYVTQHNISTTVHSGRKEGRKEEAFDRQPRGA
jgi:hypothetical protein